MADFIPLIRRAVESLSDNTPEMRVRIYDKARAAVLRQLENMQPRPPEEILRRQLENLDSAILQVEEEYSEALPVEEIITPIRLDVPLSKSNPVIIDERRESYVDDRGIVVSAPDDSNSRASAPDNDQSNNRPDMTAQDLPPNTANDTVWQAEGKSEPAPESEPPAALELTTPPGEEPDGRTLQSPPEPVDEPVAQTAWPVDIDEEPAVWVDPDNAGNEPTTQAQTGATTVQMPKAGFDEQRALADFGDLLGAPREGKEEAGTGTRQTTSGFSWDAPFEELPEPQTTAIFEQGLSSKKAEIDAGPSGATDEASPQINSNPLADLDELIGFTRDKSASSVTKTTFDVGRSRLEGRFDTRPKRKGPGVIKLAIVALVILVLSGGAFGAWYYYKEMSALIGSYLTSVDSPPKSTAAPTPKKTSKADAVIEASEPDQDASTGGQAVEPIDGGPMKFTQRLLPDGSETAGDTVALKVDSALSEGKSEAGQSVPSATEETVADAKPGEPLQDGKPVAAPQIAAEKMFLYEERLGQTSPTAITGSVAWRIKNDTIGDGKPEPVIEGEIEIGERSIKALITVKRNTDTSLPASHIIEIVFSLPSDFEGGNIESVERIALKKTEQERGNALVAVPAKITDDFHMIALNDEKEALANNLELLRTRAWIDLPITYRNGRRALISLDKGETGAAVFQKAMTQWAAIGGVSGN